MDLFAAYIYRIEYAFMWDLASKLERTLAWEGIG